MQITSTSIIAFLVWMLAIPNQALAAEGGELSNFEVSLMANGKRQGETWINLSAGGTLIEIPAVPVVIALGNLVDAATVQRIEALITKDGTLTNKILSRFGITLSINGPLRQVNLGLVKPAQKRKADPAATADSSGPADQALKPKEDSGPWTTPPVPSLSENGKAAPGKQVSQPSAAKVDSALLTEIGWEDVKPTAPATIPSGKKDSIAAPTSQPAVAAKPDVEMQTYRLDKTREELFEEVFKKKPQPLPLAVEVTLLVDGKSYGTLWINYSKELQRYTFPVDPVMSALQGLVRRDLWEKLESRAKSQSRFTVEDLIACGFPTVLNTSVFELSTGVPAQLLGTKIHPIAGQIVDPNEVPASEPAFISGYLNAGAHQKYSYFQYDRSKDDERGLGDKAVDLANRRRNEPFSTEFDGALNLKTWVIEGKGSVLEKPLENRVDYRRQDVRLVHDWPRKTLRLTAGDLIFPTSGFQGFLKMGGIGLSRDFSIQPHLVAYPVKDYEFFLTNPSEVRVYINGTLREKLNLEQGTHDLNRFPFTIGESQVEIQITDTTGQSQTLDFRFIHEPSLLAKGLSKFSYNVGFPSRDVYNIPSQALLPNRQVIADYEYDVEHPVVFLDYKRGITDRSTMESYSQAMDTAGMAGVGFLHALPIGKIKGDAAGSYHHVRQMDWAGNLEYTYIPKITSNVSPISWRLKTQYMGANFFRPGQDPTYLGALSTEGSFQKSSKLFNLNLSANYVYRFDSTDFYSVSAGLGRAWPKGFSSSLSLRNNFDREGSSNTSISANLNYNFSLDANSFSAAERIENHQPNGFEEKSDKKWDMTTDLLWEYNASSVFPNNPTASVATSFGPLNNDYSGRLQWAGNQGVAQVIGRRYEPTTNYAITNYMELNLRSSLVFANGSFAFSRPIQNSFVMVKGVKNQKDCDLIVNSTEMGYDAKASSWLPAVIPNVTPYYLKRIHIDVIDPPLGANDERTDFTVYPGYKSGYVFYMGSEATVVALGTLLLSPGVPVAYQAFTATSLDGEGEEPLMGFTNGAGKFQLLRLKPGRYRIDLELGEKSYTLVLTLPKNSVGIKSVGTLVFKQ